MALNIRFRLSCPGSRYENGKSTDARRSSTPDAAQRVASLECRIAALQQELAAAVVGDVPLLGVATGIEYTLEFYTLTTGMRDRLLDQINKKH